MIDLNFLTGKTTDQFVNFLNSKNLVHRDMNQNLLNLIKSAEQDGFEIALTSSFRSFELQQVIWNEKALGVRPVLDSNSNPIDLTDLSTEEILFSILRWSALPGASRHHWGSDLDIYDKKSISVDYKVQLIPSEYELGGPFYKLNLWLEANMHKFGFFRPYEVDKGGIAPEPWHLSYRPLSQNFLSLYSFERFEEHLKNSNFLLIEEAKQNSSEIYQKYIQL